MTAVAASVLLVAAACGEDDDENTAFCNALEEVAEDFDLGEGLDDEVREELTALEPPEAIADDWEVAVGFDVVREGAAVEEDDVAGAEELERRTEEFDDAVRNLGSYWRTECSG